MGLVDRNELGPKPEANDGDANLLRHERLRDVAGCSELTRGDNLRQPMCHRQTDSTDLGHCERHGSIQFLVADTGRRRAAG